jgi:hypothetical protein
VIRIVRARLPRGLQAFARRDGETVVVFVSAALPVGQRTTAIRRALSAAPEAGWRPEGSPVLLPALSGGLGAGRVPESRRGWALGVTAAVVAAAVTLAVPVTALTAGRHSVAAPSGRHPSAVPSAVSASTPGIAGPDPDGWHGSQRPAGHPQAAALFAPTVGAGTVLGLSAGPSTLRPGAGRTG